MDDRATDDAIQAARIGNALSKAFGRTTGPKNQHYVTRAYQELFLGKDGKLAVHDRETSKFFPVGKEGVASANKFYVFTDDQGNQRFDIEHALGVFESDAIPVIKRLCKREKIDTFERSMLSWYIATSLLRTPQALDELLRGYTTLAPLLKDHFGEESVARAFYEKEVRMDPRRAAERAAFIFGRTELKPGRQAALGLFFEVLPMIFSRLERSRWLLLESSPKAGTFIISDCGVAQIPSSQASVGCILASGMQFAFPLSPNLCLASIHSTDQSIEYKEATPNMVTSINWVIAWAAKRHLMGPCMLQVKDIATVLSTIPAGWTPAFSVETGPEVGT